MPKASTMAAETVTARMIWITSHMISYLTLSPFSATGLALLKAKPSCNVVDGVPAALAYDCYVANPIPCFVHCGDPIDVTLPEKSWALLVVGCVSESLMNLSHENLTFWPAGRP